VREHIADIEIEVRSELITITRPLYAIIINEVDILLSILSISGMSSITVGLVVPDGV
jgi:hypothetical protein